MQHSFGGHDLIGPTGFYDALKKAGKAALTSLAEADRTLLRYATNFERKLKRNDLRPTARFLGLKKDFTPLPRKPVPAPKPSAKSKGEAKRMAGFRAAMKAFFAPRPSGRTSSRPEYNLRNLLQTNPEPE